MNKIEAYASLAIGMAAAAGMLPRRLFPKDRPYQKCLLPGCEEQTNHRGGYCCAEHCKAHRDGKVVILGKYYDKGY